LNSRRAFTLIELLVVIAIIAILAAILFPVFAQAKAAAKKSASISNNKQLTLAGIMYGADYDDIIPAVAAWNQSDALVFFGAPNGGYKPWSHLIYPYMKNGDIVVDPQVGAGTKAPAGFQPLASTILAPQYGINPYLIQTVAYPYAAAGSTLNARSYTAISRPADTVFLIQKYSSKEQVDSATSAANSWYGYWFFGNNTYFLTVEVDPPDCAATGNTYYCAGGWGAGSFDATLVGGVEAAGAWTGGGSLRGTKMMIASFTDGHVAAKTPGALAEGTAYNGAKNASGVPIQNQSAVAITDITKEHWYGLQ
jgi:prepilin-type N-terminal cleavage/methylation domain-containing protein